MPEPKPASPLVMLTEDVTGHLMVIVGLTPVHLTVIGTGGLFTFRIGGHDGLPSLEVQLIKDSDLREALDEHPVETATMERVYWDDIRQSPGP